MKTDIDMQVSIGLLIPALNLIGKFALKLSEELANLRYDYCENCGGVLNTLITADTGSVVKRCDRCGEHFIFSPARIS